MISTCRRLPAFAALLLCAALLAMAQTSEARTGHQESHVACTGHALFEAAVKKEGFNPNDPSYKSLSKVGNGPTAYEVKCSHGWALALVSRPKVGTTDGSTLFKVQDGSWIEVAQLYSEVAGCLMEKHGAPPAVAKALDYGTMHLKMAGC
jgi:hypothetical protein